MLALPGSGRIERRLAGDPFSANDIGAKSQDDRLATHLYKPD
jgi:hypothetical protein